MRNPLYHGKLLTKLLVERQQIDIKLKQKMTKSVYKNGNNISFYY